MINKFDSKYDFLSNFYPSPISDGNVTFPTVEHYFQAAKTADMDSYLKIAEAKSPGDAKRFGRQCELRLDWEDIKEQVMLDALRKKFTIPHLRQALLNTGYELLEEGNTWHDNYWGNCHCPKCEKIIGQNKLGKLLMQIRKEILEDAHSMKWHIYDATRQHPLCWDDKALFFSTKEFAEKFLESCKANAAQPNSFYDGAVILENILFYDGGHMNGDYCSVASDDDGDELLNRDI